MKVKNLNASSRKTKSLIKENFAILMKEKKELRNITVTELVTKANITRSTFYTHYDNIYDVAKDFQDETLNLISIDTTTINSIDDLDNYLDKIFNYLEENQEIYKNVLSSDEPLLFTYKLNKLMYKNLYNILNNKHSKTIDMTISFLVDGCITLIIKHFRGEINYTLEEIKEYIKIIFKKILEN